MRPFVIVGTGGMGRELLGYVLLALGRAQDARTVLDLAVERITDSGNLWFWTSKARQAVGDSEGAADAAEQALSLDPENTAYREHIESLRTAPARHAAGHYHAPSGDSCEC